MANILFHTVKYTPVFYPENHKNKQDKVTDNIVPDVGPLRSDGT